VKRVPRLLIHVTKIFDFARGNKRVAAYPHAFVPLLLDLNSGLYPRGNVRAAFLTAAIGGAATWIADLINTWGENGDTNFDTVKEGAAEFAPVPGNLFR